MGVCDRQALMQNCVKNMHDPGMGIAACAHSSPCPPQGQGTSHGVLVNHAGVRGKTDSLQAEGGHSEGDAGSELGEEDVERVEDGFMAFTVGVGQSEVIYHIGQHGPGLQTETNTHTCSFK